MRTYKRKTERASISESHILEALMNIQNKRMTLREASAHYGIKYSTLLFRLKRVRAEMGPDFDPEDLSLKVGLRNKNKMSKNSSHQVFHQKEENMLVEYLITCSKLSYGLTMDALRELAYLFAVSLDRQFPEKWINDKKAGKEWAMGFIKRHRAISLRKPENTSLARNTGFNRTNLSIFYDNLQAIMEQHKFGAEKIWNLDETGLSTVLQAPKVVAPANARQVGQCVSNERGEKVSIVGIISAAGEYLPPVYIFPRKRTHPEYMEGAPKDSISLFNSKGYMDSEGFLKTLEHIKTYAMPSKEDPILLILDNHASHLTIDAIRLCREFGIHMVSLPPHTSHKTQPLDLTVFGPFKSYCKTAFNTWLTENPGQRITLHNIARISASSIVKSFSKQNIKSGFTKSGIYPLDRSKIFKDLESLENQTSLMQTSSELTTEFQDTVETSFDFSADCPGLLHTPSVIRAPLPNYRVDDTLHNFYEANHKLMETSGPSNAMCAPPLRSLIDISAPPDFSAESHVLMDTSGPSSAPLDHLDAICAPPDVPMHSSSPPNAAYTSPLNHFDIGIGTPLDINRESEMSMDHCGSPSPLDLSMSSTTASLQSTSYSQLRFGGLEVLRPIPNPLAFHTPKVSHRGMISTIVTGSPELKRKEEIQMKKGSKKENLGGNEMPMPQKKRGRPRKIPVSDSTENNHKRGKPKKAGRV